MVTDVEGDWRSSRRPSVVPTGPAPMIAIFGEGIVVKKRVQIGMSCDVMLIVSVCVFVGAHSCKPLKLVMGKGSFIDALHLQRVTELTCLATRGQACPSSGSFERVAERRVESLHVLPNPKLTSEQKWMFEAIITTRQRATRSVNACMGWGARKIRGG